MAEGKSKVQTAPDPDHEQQPADETIAAGEHMDLEAMDEAWENEKRAGASAPTGLVLPAPSTVQNPYVSEEMQGMEMESKVFGPPQYGSPDPASAASRLMTLEDGHPLAGLEEGTAAISEDYGRAYGDTSEIDATDDARELAEKEGVNLAAVEGTGKDGRITKGDVEKVVSASDENN